MKLSKPKRIIKSFYDATLSKPITLARAIQLFIDLSSLSKEEIGPEADAIEKITNTIKGFGLKKEIIQQAKEHEFTTNQWKRLRDMIKKQYPKISEWQLSPWLPKEHQEIDTDKIPLPSVGTSPVVPTKPKKEKRRLIQLSTKKQSDPIIPETTKKYRVDLTKLAGEVVVVVMNLFDEISKGDLASSVTVPVLDYFAFIKILSEEHPDLPGLLYPIEKVLKSHGWTSGGFISPPNIKLLLDDLREIIGRGLDFYRKFRKEERLTEPIIFNHKKEETLLGSLISNLTNDLEPETANEAVSQFFDLTSTIAETDEEFNEKIKPVKLLLKTRGWVGDHFDEPPDCSALRKELLALL